MEDLEQEVRATDARLRQLTQQRNLIQQTQKAAAKRKQASTAASRVAARQLQSVEEEALSQVNDKLNERLSKIEEICQAVSLYVTKPPDGSFALLSDFQSVLQAQEEFIRQHDAWKKQQFEEGPSKLVAAEDPTAYMPADLSAATLSLPPFKESSNRISIENNNPGNSNRANKHGQENSRGNPMGVSASREAAYHKNLVALQDLRRVAEASEAKYIDARVVAAGNTAAAEWIAREVEMMRKLREKEGGGGRELVTGGEKEAAENLPAMPLSGREDSSSGNARADISEAKREELRAIRCEIEQVQGSVRQLCAERGRLQDIYVFHGDYDLKLQRQEFYMAKLRAALHQQHALLASNVALHLACVADVRRLAASTKLLLFVARQLAAVFLLAEHRQGDYKRVVKEVEEECRIVADILQGRSEGGEGWASRDRSAAASHSGNGSSRDSMLSMADKSSTTALCSSSSSSSDLSLTTELASSAHPANDHADGSCSIPPASSATALARTQSMPPSLAELKCMVGEPSRGAQQLQAATATLSHFLSQLQATEAAALAALQPDGEGSGFKLGPRYLQEQMAETEAAVNGEVRGAVEKVIGEWQKVRHNATLTASQRVRMEVLGCFFNNRAALPEMLAAWQAA